MILLMLFACDGDEPKPEPEALPSLDDATFVVRGDAGDLAGSALTTGDLDGDGVDDLVVAGLGGRITCVLPGPVGAGEHSLREAPSCLGQAADFDFAGYAVASGVDLDGDGVDELLVGAPGSDAAAESAGAVWLVGGPPPVGESSVSAAGTPRYGVEAAGALGTSVAFAGDQDGDGVEELLLGAPGSDLGARDAGAVYLLDPNAPGPYVHEWASAWFVGGGATEGSPAKHAESVLGDGVGNAVCRAGDLDGDGLPDVVIPAPGWDGGAENAGAVAIFAGPIAEGGHGIADADVLLRGVTAGGYFGGAMACGGDTDGDGRPELLVGADADDGGRVYLWLGGLLTDEEETPGAAVFAGTVTGDQAGYAVAFVPDPDGDGVAIGAPSADDAAVDAGMVAVFTGPITLGTLDLADADARWAGVGAGDLAGAALVGVEVGGAPGVAVGAPYNRDGAPIGGAVYGVGP